MRSRNGPGIKALSPAAKVRGEGERPWCAGSVFRRKQREKGSGKAICATARKLLTVIYVPLTRQLEYWFLEERLNQRKLKDRARAA